MTHFDFHITTPALEFFQTNSKKVSDFVKINNVIKKTCGISNFFMNQEEVNDFSVQINEYNSIVSEPHRRQYGDYQTNNELASDVVKYALKKFGDIEFLLEPTCGRGNFIIAAIEQVTDLKKIIGVEIYLPYIWETKFKILTHYLNNPQKQYPEIDIIHQNVFDFPFEEVAQSTKQLKTLVIGNPPWVTNSELGSIESNNLPKKSNFKKHSGFDAITGKGNFDIGESISLIMLKCFQKHNGGFAFLIKNSVIKNLIHDQKVNNFWISNSQKLNIDSKKEFNVSVNASLFIAHLNIVPEYTCCELDFYNNEFITKFGWHEDKFVYSIRDYSLSSLIDGKSPFTWRSGVKHDCSKVMEFESLDTHFINGLGEIFDIEEDLVYGLLKSSDLKLKQTKTYRKHTIITQRRVGGKTNYIKQQFPLTFKYLESKKDHFDKRKSSIYRDKPEFSIFGIGNYSFAKYKIAVSGLYKTTHFTLVLPSKSKPIMLDDTCYFIGFEEYKIAQIAHFLVNTELVQKFLKSIIFPDAKRAINKGILMRIDFEKAYSNSSYQEAQRAISNLRIEQWEEFGKMVQSEKQLQMTLF